MQNAVALEQERLLMAERLLTDIERRHGLPHTPSRDIHPFVVDRFLVAYLPETHDGEPVPQAVEFAFTPTLSEAVDLLRRTVNESDHGFGTACYIHDLNTGSETD
jgi:hypothetical protein